MSLYSDNSCFDNLIGLDGTCSDASSTSGLFASTLGITTNFLSQIITEQYADVNDLFQKKLKQATDVVVSTLHTHFSDKYRTVSVVDNLRTGKVNENKVVVAATNNYKGILFDLCSEKSYLDFYLSSIDLFVNYSGTVPVLVIDLIEGRIIKTLNVQTVAGQISTIYPSQIFESKKRKLKLFICYDTTGIPSYKTTLKQSDCSSCLPSHKLSYSYEEISSCTIELTDDLITSSVRYSQDTGGLSITHSLQCNHRDWMCSVANQLSYPILYKLGSLFFEMALTEVPNDRINTTVTNNADLIRERINLSESKFNEAMRGLVTTMNPPEDENCFICKKRSRHAIILP